MKKEIKNAIRLIVYAFFSFVNLFTYKKKQIFVYGGEILNNNSEAMVRNLMKSEYKVICMADKHMNYENANNITFVPNTYKNALLGLWTSRVVLDSFPHTIKMIPTKRQLFLQFWHGSPMKYLHKPSKIIKNGTYYTKIFYSADIFKKQIKNLFSCDDYKLYKNGTQHSDYLLMEWSLPNNYKKTRWNIMWMPTYRDGIGVKLTKNSIPVINKSNISLINDFLKHNDTTLFIKAHILQNNGLKEIMGGKVYSNIILMNEQDFVKHNIPVYGFLGCMDALITDYSGVYFDFLLTDKPIGFAIDDYDEYNSSVGTIFDNIYDNLAGPIIEDLDALYTFILDVRNAKNEYKDKRETMRMLTNTYNDGKNCERTLELINRFFKDAE